jgi:protein-tyrosine phosphatase
MVLPYFHRIMNPKTKVLFVCLGNICRSPLAEGLFRQAVEERGTASHFEIDSCGTNGLHDGELPDPRTRENAASLDSS